MVKIIFKCLRCGRCCRQLLVDMTFIEGGLSGLSLSITESKLFPKKFISPQTGIGLERSGPKHVLSYQLNVNVCPYISEDNLCKIYSSRPLACQAFSLRSLGLFGTTLADPADCSFVEQAEKKFGSLTGIRMTPENFKAPEEWKAVAEMNKRIMKSYLDHFEDARILWFFDLKSKEWQISRAF